MCFFAGYAFIEGMKKNTYKPTAEDFAQRNLEIMRAQFAASAITMPQFDNKTAALAVAVFAKIGGDKKILKTAKLAMTELA